MVVVVDLDVIQILLVNQDYQQQHKETTIKLYVNIKTTNRNKNGHSHIH